MKILVIVLVVLVIAVPAGLYFGGFIHLGGEAASSGENKEEHGKAAESAHGTKSVPTYLTLEPPFVVNFTHRGTLRYLQVSLDISYDDVLLLDKVKERMPAVRNDLIMLFSNQDYEVLSSAEGKQHLRHEIMHAINRIIGVSEPKPSSTESNKDNEHGADKTDEVGTAYITNFVMQ